MRKERFTYIIDDENAPPQPRLCDKNECEEIGEFRAPKSREDLRDYYWFCLDHVREYNKSWDFYKDMSPEEIERSRVSDVTWNRPSWPVGGWRVLLENAEYLDGLDPFLTMRSQNPSIPPHVKKALSVLGLSLPITLPTLKKEYKKLAKKHHPDLNAGDKEAEDRLKAINAAYHIVKKFLDK